MEIRIARKEDLERLKTIWKRCFGDEDRYIGFYFDNRNWTKEMAVLLVGNTIASMLAMIPAERISADGRAFSTAMLYAVATHPDYQRQGLADKLMEYSNHYLISKQIPETMLVPAEESLFDFYEKRGYKEAFFVRQVELTTNEIDCLAGTDPMRCQLQPAEPGHYNDIRRKLLQGHSYIDYNAEEISFQKKECQLLDSDIFVIVPEERKENAAGCAAIERISEAKVIVKEFLIPEKYQAAVLAEIKKQIPAEKYVVRTPEFSGEGLGGAVRSFGMLRLHAAENAGSARAYLGIAYD